MGVFDKLRNIVRVKASQAAWVIAPSGSGQMWPERNYDNFAKEAYMSNVIASRCIREIAEAVASVEWKVVKKMANGEKEDQPNHWLVPLLVRANPYEGFAHMMMKTAAYYELSGNAFMERIMVAGDRVRELYSHRPSRFKVIVNPSTGLLEGYEFEVGGKKQMYPVDIVTQQSDILHMKTFHPLNDWWGLSNVEVAAKEIDTRNQAVAWNFNLLRNSARPGMQYLFKGSLSDAEFERLEHHLFTKYAGPENAGMPLIIAGADDVKAEPSGFSPQEMEFIEGNREWARNIAYSFGVPPQMIGIPGDNTYSNQKEAREAFWTTTVTFRVNYFKGELNNWLLAKERDILLEPDFNNVAALESRHEKKWDRSKAADGILTINERRKLLGYEPIDGGDVILVSATMMPLGEDLDDGSGDGDSDGADDETGDDEDTDNE